VRRYDLAAVVSNAPQELRARRRDLERHHRILERLSGAGAVLPMPFGMLASCDVLVRRELESGAERYRGLLAHVDGRIELNVKVVHRERTILRDLLLQCPPLRKLNEALSARGGGSYEDRVVFGKRIATATADRRAHEAARVLSELQPHAVQVRLGPAVDGCLLNASFLVPAAGRQRFEHALSRARQALTKFAEVRIHGPLPSYSFAAMDHAGNWQ
jgi:hypothetical protein